MVATLRRLSFSPRTIPVAFFIVTALTYGPLIPWLGFYWDDWPYLWLYHVEGPLGFPAYVASDRPFSAWIFMLTTALFGEHAALYHLLALVLRWLGAVLIWYVLRQVWPTQNRIATWTALLFIVYPGFVDQPIALIYNHHLSVLDLFLLSLSAMLLALRKSRWYWPLTMLALFASLGMFSIEYFVGLELIRPVLSCIVLRDQIPQPGMRFRRVMLHWSPYLLVMTVFLIWRVVIFKFPSYQPRAIALLSGNFLKGLGSIFRTVLFDLYQVTILAWGKGLNWPAGRLTLLAYIGLVLLSAACLFIFLTRLRVPDQESPIQETPDHSNKEMFLVGLLALLLAGPPVWITNLPVTLVFPYDRLTLAFIPGASLVVTALLGLVSRLRLFRPSVPVLLALLLSLSIGYHFQNGNVYRRDFELMRRFFWQLSWRAPGLQPGTIVVIQKPPWVHFSDNSLTSPLNWTYAPDSQSELLQYMFYDAEVRVGRGIPRLEEGLEVNQQYRSFTFSGSSSDLLAVFYTAGSCVRVLDTIYADHFPGLPDPLRDVVLLSKPELILTEASPGAHPPLRLLGPEPSHNWCYYFEKAELARQQGDWKAIGELWNQAAALEPNTPSELLVFVEALARLKDWSTARDLSARVALTEELRPMVCSTWQRVAGAGGLLPGEQNEIIQAMAEAQCALTE